MDNTPRQVLKELIATYGPALCDNPQRCKGLLLDRCQEQRREINILIQALEEQVAVDLRQASVTPYPILQTRLVKRLEDLRAMTEEAARWAVDSWALALGVIQKEPARPAIPKAPPPPPPPVRQTILEAPLLTGTQVQTGPIAPTQMAIQGQTRPTLSSHRLRAGLIYGVISGVLALIIAPILYNLYVQTQAYGLIGTLDVCAFGIAMIAVGVLSARASGSVLSAGVAGGFLGLGLGLGTVIADSADLALGFVVIYVVVISIISMLFGFLGRYLYRRSHASS